MVCIGTLDDTNVIDMKIGIRKRLSIIFTYGGQKRDLQEVLDLISKKAIQPQVDDAKLKDFLAQLSIYMAYVLIFMTFLPLLIH